ncbi:MAG: T9SS type A sorting domain-containing protein [Cyclobacteriaceae bacterium]
MMKSFTYHSPKMLLLGATLFFLGNYAFAQDVYSIENQTLNSADLTGSYVLKTSADTYMFATGADAYLSTSALPTFQLDLSIVPASDPVLYYVKWGEQYLQHSHGWDPFFSATSSNNTWQIDVNTVDNTIVLRRGADNSKYLKFENGSFYSDGGSGNDVNYELWTVTGTESSLITPEPELQALVNDALVLNETDLSGQYAIEYNATTYMGFNSTSLVAATSTPMYAFDLVKNEDGSYQINGGDWGAVYTHNWELQFGLQPEASNSWLIAVVEGDWVTIQRNDGSGNYIKYESGNFYQDSGSPVNFRLRGIVDPATTNIWDGMEWSDGTAPTGSDNAYVNGALDVSATMAVNDIEVSAFGSITVSGGATLTVNGDLDGLGAVVVESGSFLMVTGMADIRGGSTFTVEGSYESTSTVVSSGSSMITNSTSTIVGDITVQRNTRYADGKYSFVGSPVVQDAGNTGAALGPIVYKYNEATAYGADGLARWEDASSDQLMAGRGYAQAGQQMIEFTGALNTGTVTVNGTYTGTPDDATDEENEGWNLVANPYAAAINVDLFLQANTNTTGAVYIWDDNGSDVSRGSNADYITANAVAATQNSAAGNGDRYNLHIGSAQGFFVQLDGVSGNDISFTETMRVSGENDDDAYFRKDENAIPYVRINLTGAKGIFKQAIVGRVNGISDEHLNQGLDAPIFNPNAANAIYSIKEGRSLAISAASYTKELIPLGLNVAESGVYQIDINTENFSGQTVYIYDNQTGTTHDFELGAYSFSTVGGSIVGRFSLTFSKASVLATVDNNSWKVYASDNILHINPSVEDRTPRTYSLYNLSGKFILSTIVNEKISIDLNALHRGVYLVSDGITTQKIVVQ